VVLLEVSAYLTAQGGQVSAGSDIFVQNLTDFPDHAGEVSENRKIPL